MRFKDLLVWVDDSPISKCCKSEPAPIEQKETTTTIKETSENLMTESLLDEGDSLNGNFRTIEESGLDSIRKKIEDIDHKSLSNEETRIERENRPPTSKGIPILKSINGTINSEEMVAILGPSGSGKTTLMNFVSSRSNWDKKLFIDGELYLNNFYVKNLSRYKHLLGFVPQEDLIIEDLSIRQNLEQYGRLRGVPDFRDKAAKVIKDLGLEKCQNTTIGGETKRGVSGGERKRACIGVELMGDPKILFLDEPTTGIDAFTALEVIKTLQRLNEESGLGVVAVIHQPRQEIIEKFHRVGQLVLLGFLIC